MFIVHAYKIWYHTFNLQGFDLEIIAHFSVIVFFALSGYLISYTTFNNDRGIMQYAQARLSRLYSVLFPAIIITVVCQWVLWQTDPQTNIQFLKPQIGLRYVLAAFYITDVWFKSATPPLNGPLWSLGYEFWYYVIFGLWFYYRNTSKRLFIFIAALVAGPSILLMMPIWILGGFAYKIKKPVLPTWLSYIIFIVLLMGGLLLAYNFGGIPRSLGYAPLYYAS
ncbi:acyltransferase family protein [Mucilaginibacter sp. PAMB04274]|uniref:acyltransferase family protein n=1 Tax=Mucilaginibacter sp. PAMB04274 TaxID=3138568 RepID=UPI0031F5FA2C